MIGLLFGVGRVTSRVPGVRRNTIIIRLSTTGAKAPNASESYTFSQSMEFLKPYASTLIVVGSGVLGCGTLAWSSSRVVSKLEMDIATLKATMDEKFKTTDEKFKTTDEKISKVQDVASAKIDAVRAQAEVDTNLTFFKFNHDEQFASLRPKNAAPAQPPS